MFRDLHDSSRIVDARAGLGRTRHFTALRSAA
jgi:hypothetical protein